MKDKQIAVNNNNRLNIIKCLLALGYTSKYGDAEDTAKEFAIYPWIILYCNGHLSAHTSEVSSRETVTINDLVANKEYKVTFVDGKTVVEIEITKDGVLVGPSKLSFGVLAGPCKLSFAAFTAIAAKIAEFEKDHK